MIATIEDQAGYNALIPSAPPSPPAAVRVWLTDDNARFRSSLAELLQRTGGFNCERQFDSAEALLAALATGPAPDAILLDVEMGGISGVAALRPIRRLAPDVRVLILTTFFDPVYRARAERDAASAFFIKADAPQRLGKEIHRALAAPVPELAPEPILNQPKTHPIPRRESAAKSFSARLSQIRAGVAAALFGPWPYRPAATPK